MQIGVSAETIATWEKGNSKPVAAQLKPLLAFLGYAHPAERAEAKQRVQGVSLAQIARQLGWDPAP